MELSLKERVWSFLFGFRETVASEFRDADKTQKQEQNRDGGDGEAQDVRRTRYCRRCFLSRRRRCSLKLHGSWFCAQVHHFSLCRHSEIVVLVPI